MTFRTVASVAGRPAVGLVAALLAGVSLASVAEAQSTVVVPNQYTSTAASTSGLNTFIRDINNPRAGQLLIAAAELSTILPGGQITGMRYRMWTGATTPYPGPAGGATWANYIVSLGPGGPLPGSTTFANNFTAPPTVVRTGPLTIPQGACTAGANPNAFCTFEITFTTPFVYNGGNLCVEIRHTGSNITNTPSDFLEVALTTDPNYNSRFWSATATTMNATTGTVANYTVARFTFTPVPVEIMGFTVE